MITKQKSLEFIKNLGLSTFVLALYDGVSIELPVEIYFGCPEEFFMMTEKEQEEYTENKLIPIIDDGNFGNVIFFDTSNNTYIKFDIESPEDQEVYYNWQQVLLCFFYSMYDHPGWENKLVDIASYIGLENPQKHLEAFKILYELPYEESEDAVYFYITKQA